MDVTRIIDLPSKTYIEEGDYIAIDNQQDGTQKVQFTNLFDSSLSQSDKIAPANTVGQQFTNTNTEITALRAAVGSPLKASTVAQMTDTNKIYVYTGSESGYTAGNWYYYNGTAWASGGVYNSIAIETDKTLTVSDMAADAKVVGDDITNIKSEINQLYFPLETTSQNGYLTEYKTYAGTTSYHSISSKPIKVSEGEVFRYKGYGAYSGKSVLFLDNNQSVAYTRTYDSKDAYTEVTVPEDVSYAIFSSYTEIANEVVFDVKKQNDTVIDIIENDINSLEDKYNGLYFPIGTTSQNGYLTEYNTYASTSSYHSISSEMIKVAEGDVFKYKGYGAYSAKSALFFDSSQAVVATRAYDSTTGYTEITIPSGVVYAKFSSYSEIANNVVFDIKKVGTIIDSLESDIVSLENEKDANVLWGKSIALDGDSICYGAGFLGGYGKIIADRNNMTYQNIAVVGGTLASDTYYQDSTPRHWICQTLQTVEEYDYIIFEGGINDAFNSVAIGEITSGYDATLDTTTMCGGLEKCCKVLAQKYVQKKCGFVFPHRIINYGDWATRKAKMVEILEKWGVPYIDLENEIPPIGFMTTLKNAFTQNGDGTHPNELGYRKFYVDKIESWMKTL